MSRRITSRLRESQEAVRFECSSRKQLRALLGSRAGTTHTTRRTRSTRLLFLQLVAAQKGLLSLRSASPASAIESEEVDISELYVRCCFSALIYRQSVV